MNQLKAPRKITKLWLFLDLCIIFWWLIPNFLYQAAPLNVKLQKSETAPFGHFKDKELKFMNLVKDVHVSIPILALPNSTERMATDTDTYIFFKPDA